MLNEENFKANEILDDAKSVINRLDPGTEFKLKDLFKGIDWDRFPKKERLSAGITFKSDVDAGRYPVIFTGKTSSNLAVYKKIGKLD